MELRAKIARVLRVAGAIGVIGCGEAARGPADVPDPADGIAEVVEADADAPGDTAAVEDLAGPADAVADGAVDAASPNDTLGPLAVPLAALCTPWAEVTCQLTAGCARVTSTEAVAACQTHAAAVCEAHLAVVGPLVEAGAVRYDADLARACLTGASILDCAPTETLTAALPAACAEVFSGQLGADEACSWAGACAAGLNCVAAGDGTCPGTCQAAPGVGQACDSRFSPCVAGAWCELGVCVADAVALDAPCAVTAQCPAGAFCDDGESPARCRTRRVALATCADDDACAEGLFCAVIDFADVGECTPQNAPGAACTPFLSGTQCAGGQVCDMERAVCVAPPDRPGDACVADWQPCGDGGGLYCDPASETCAALPAVGAPCGAGASETCGAGYCTAADGLSSGVCAAFAAPGAACDEARACGGLDCVAGVCARDDAQDCFADRRRLELGVGLAVFGEGR